MAYKSKIRITVEMEVDGDKTAGFDVDQHLKFLRCRRPQIISKQLLSSIYVAPTGIGCDAEKLQRLRKTNLHRAILNEVIGDHFKVVSKNSKKDNPEQKFTVFVANKGSWNHQVFFTFDDKSNFIVGAWYHGAYDISSHSSHPAHLFFSLNDPNSLINAKKLIDKAMEIAKKNYPPIITRDTIFDANAALEADKTA